jgi:hypothetical protein
MLSQQEIDALVEKQERVFDQINWINAVLAGTNLPPDDQGYVSVEEGAADLFEFVKTNGLVTMELVLLGDYWQQPIYTERFQASDPDSIFARLGFVTAMSSHKIYQFEQFIATQKATAPPPSRIPEGKTPMALRRRTGESQ